MKNNIKKLSNLSLIFTTWLFCPLINLSIVHGQEPTIFKFIKTVEITPDINFQTGSFARINYIPATDKFVVTFGTKHDDSPSLGRGAGYAYKEYTTDMQETGKAGTFTWNPNAIEANDSGSMMIDNSYYFVHVPTDTTEFYGWIMTKFDAINWNIIAETYIPCLYPQEKTNDPMVAHANGTLDISSQHDFSGTPPPLDEGAATHHHFFSIDLEPKGLKILNDTPHVCG
ncbi:hypothetical protein ACFLS9_03795 [Bacteroidota bacterium]